MSQDQDDQGKHGKGERGSPEVLDEIGARLGATLETLRKRGGELGEKVRDRLEHASDDARAAWEREIKPRLSEAEAKVSKAADTVGEHLSEATEDVVEQVKKKFGELRQEVSEEIERRRGSKPDAASDD